MLPPSTVTECKHIFANAQSLTRVGDPDDCSAEVGIHFYGKADNVPIALQVVNDIIFLSELLQDHEVASPLVVKDVAQEKYQKSHERHHDGTLELNFQGW